MWNPSQRRANWTTTERKQERTLKTFAFKSCKLFQIHSEPKFLEGTMRGNMKAKISNSFLFLNFFHRGLFRF